MLIAFLLSELVNTTCFVSVVGIVANARLSKVTNLSHVAVTYSE